MKKALLSLAVLLFVNFGMAQMDPVQWSFESQKVDDNHYDLIITADVNDGWYIYSQNMEEGGPIPTSFFFNVTPGFTPDGAPIEKGDKKEGYDEIFGMNVISLKGKVLFTQRIKLSGKVDKVSGYLEFMTCNGEVCMPPKSVDFDIPLK